MPSATVQNDTQVVDLDSPRSANGDSGYDSGDHFLAVETLPNDYEETERLYDSGDDDGEGVEDWGETQLLGDIEETAVVQEGDDIEVGPVTERAELPRADGFHGQGESGFETEDEKLVDADASTDGEEDCGSSGPEFNLDEEIDKHNQGKAKNSQIEMMRSNCMDAFPGRISDPNFVGTKEDETALDHDAENSRHIMSDGTYDFENRSTKPAVEKSCSETIRLQDEETTKRSDLDKWASPHPVLCAQSAAGLSYISSQEPGVHSQANALCVVDEFLTFNYLGMSQDDDNEKAAILKSPPTANLKRPQHFARMSDRSSDVNLRVYEWIDFLENEVGDELFSKKESYCFADKVVKPSLHSLPSTVKRGEPEMVISGVNKSNTKGSKSRTLQKLALTRSDSTNAKRIARISEASSKKKIFNDMNKQSVTELKHLERAEVDNTVQVYDVGPATQMAAEAIQALAYSSPVNEQLHLHLNNGKLAGVEVGKSTKTRSKKKHKQKRSYRSPNTDSNLTRSKHLNSIHSESRAKRSNRFKKGSTDLRMNGVLDESTVGMTAKMKMKKNTKGNRDFTASVVGEVAQDTIDDSYIGEIVMPPVLVTPSKHPCVNERYSVGSSNIYTSPIACRTRHSQAAKLSKFQTEHVLNASEASEVHECGRASLNKTTPDVRDSSHADICYKTTTNTEETGISLDIDTDRKSKRQKIKHFVFDNKTIINNKDDSSELVDVVSSKVAKHGPLIRGIAEILDTVKRKKRSMSSRSKFNSKELASNDGKMQRNYGVRSRSSMPTDLLNPFFANDSHLRTQENKLASERTTNTCSFSGMKQYADSSFDKTDASNSRLLPEVVPGKMKSEGQPKGSHNGKVLSNLEGSPKGKGRPSLQCSQKTDTTNTVSPIYISQDTTLISCGKSLFKPSVAKELFRLEANETTKNWKLKDTRKRKDMSSFQICFSQHLGREVIKQQKKILSRLGIQVVSSSSEATHFIADKFVRTRNMLEAIATGKPVVTPMWLESCGQASCYIDEKNYILRDAKKEKEIGFNMPNSLARARQRPLLQDKRVFITPKTKPNQDLISCIIKAAQGKVLPLKELERYITREDKLPDDLLILTSEEDFAVCIPFLEKGVAVFSSELLLNGIVVQKLEYARHRLFLDHVKKTRSTVWLRGEDGQRFLPVKRCR